jgi:hypothetical protein
MYPDHLPQDIVRTLGAAVLFLYDLACVITQRTVQRLRPLVEPPVGLRVVGPSGVTYAGTGVVILEGGYVVAGFVIEAGHAAPRREDPPYRAPIVTPPPRYEDRRSAHLPSWADDPRELLDEEEERWRRR